MKKSLKIIGIFATTITILTWAYLLGALQSSRKVEIKIITEEVNMPDEHIPLNDDFKNNFVDMRKVTDYTANDNSLQIFLG